jgi:hypothetical protein
MANGELKLRVLDKPRVFEGEKRLSCPGCPRLKTAGVYLLGDRAAVYPNPSLKT